MTVMKFDDRSDLYCIGWGNLLPEDGGTHMNCPVVLTKDSVHESAIASELLSSGQSFPMVCSCDCKICKRAWWEEGRPIIRMGKIVTTKKEDAWD